MNGIGLDLRAPRFGDTLSRVLRCPVGNTLLVANTLLLIRGALLRPFYEHEHVDCILVGEPDPVIWAICSFPSTSEVLYTWIHLPALLLVSAVEALLQPAWDMLCIVTASQLENVLFALASGLQWLVVGSLSRGLLLSCMAGLRERRAARSAPPEPVQLTPFEQSEAWPSR